MTGGLSAGKLPASLLGRLLARLDISDPRIVIGPGIGEDAAVIDMGSNRLIVKTDPITFATDLIGWYAVQVNANDIVATGGDPKWFLATVLLPEGTTPEAVERVFEQLRDAASGLGVTLVGGHTEITTSVSRPVVCGLMLGEAPPEGVISTGGARAGDALMLTKGIAIEGTAVLAREMGERLAEAGVDAATLDRAREYLFEPGISVVDAARAARSAGGVHAMHDPTEGGLATALSELAAASGTGIRVDPGAVTVLPETAAICDALGGDPWGLLASGALLIAAAPESAPDILAALGEAGIPARQIGAVTEASEGLKLAGEAGLRGLPQFDRDEAIRLLEDR